MISKRYFTFKFLKRKIKYNSLDCDKYITDITTMHWEGNIYL